VPLNTIPDSYEQSLKSLPEARKHADDVLVYDNTPDGKGHRLVARFIAGELVKTTHTSPEWLKRVFGRELTSQTRQQEKSRDRR
jgi:predicted ABC-type ATPase